MLNPSFNVFFSPAILVACAFTASASDRWWDGGTGNIDAPNTDTAIFAAPVLCSTGSSQFAEDPSKATDKLPAAIPAATAKAGEAAGVGAWTTDYPAALKVSKERKIPMFIQFTGSDWCGWCQWMEAACLSKPRFLEAMKDQCVLLVVDFPQKIAQPDALKAQNKALSEKYKKTGGFPAYKIVDFDGETILWAFGADPKYCDPKRGDLNLFINDVKDMCASGEGVIERTVKGLAPEKAAAYRAAAKEYRAIQLETVAWFAKDKKDADKARIKQDYNAFVARLKEKLGMMAAAANQQQSNN